MIATKERESFKAVGGATCQQPLGKNGEGAPCGRHASYVVAGLAVCTFHLPVLDAVQIYNALSDHDRRIAKLEGG